MPWFVSVATDDQDPLIFGPYPKHRAEFLALRFNERIDRAEFDYIHATATQLRKPRTIAAMLREFGQ